MRRILFGFGLVLLIGACSASDTPRSDDTPSVGVPDSHVNSELRLWAPEEINTFKINEPIWLAVEVVAKEEVIFERDYGNRMFRYSDGDWKEIENVPTDWGEGQFLLSPSNGDPAEWGSTRVFPWFDDTAGPIRIRVFVVGALFQHGTESNERVAAYVDITLTD